MNIFVLNTGRCGSTTFAEACKHITNYSSAHESCRGMLHQERLNYAKNHIEVDNRLSWILGRLDKKYGDRAFYVHLKRNKSDVAHSFTKRYEYGIINAYRKAILIGLPENSDPISVSLDYCNTVNSNIELFLKDKSNKITITLENVDQGFKEFWSLIGAEGNIETSLSEFKINHNATIQPDLPKPSKSLHLRFTGKLKRLLTNK